MAGNEKKERTLWEQAVENALHFTFNLAFVLIFQSIFGIQDVLPGVTIGTGMTMFPDGYIGVRPVTMAGIIIGLYCGCVIAEQIVPMLPAATLVIDFPFVPLAVALICEPTMYEPAISLLLCSVFVQFTPVLPVAFPMRPVGAVAGITVMAVTTVIKWYWQGRGEKGHDLKEQIRLYTVRKGYILRMSTEIATAMFMGMALRLRKPLWISIVVMSLTQLHYHEALECIHHRFLGNILGILFFVVVLCILVPESWAFGMVLFLGYISFLTSEYKHKQIADVVSAINASLVFLDTSTAIKNRLLCLVGGACIMLILYLAQKLGRGIMGHIGAAVACRTK